MSKASRARWAEIQDTGAKVQDDFEAACQYIDGQLDKARKRGAFIAERVTVNAAMAKALLDRSRGNVRHESDPYIASIAADMVAGRFRWTQQGIALDEDGALYDGHHRMKALCRAAEDKPDVTILINIAFGYPRESVQETDGGRPRSVSMRLQESSKIVSAVRAAIRMEHANPGSASPCSLSEVEEAMDRLRGPIEALRPLICAKHSAAFWGSVIYAFPLGPQTMVRFGEEVVRGAVPGTPAFVMREYLMDGSTGGRASAVDTAMRSLYAIRAALNNKPMSRFSPKDGDKVFEWFAARLASGRARRA